VRISLTIFTGILVIAAAAAGWKSWKSRPSQPAGALPALETILSRAPADRAEKIRQAELVLVNFWASWCQPCFSETPSLIRLAQSRKDKLALVSISQDSATAEFQGFLKIYPALSSAAGLILRDSDQSLSREFGVDRLPDSFLFSRRSGKFVRIGGAVNWSEPGLLEKLSAGL
jgi:thiol-disulfide isomerase/thioredoxin